jgi:hypothetical protein
MVVYIANVEGRNAVECVSYVLERMLYNYAIPVDAFHMPGANSNPTRRKHPTCCPN